MLALNILMLRDVESLSDDDSQRLAKASPKAKSKGKSQPKPKAPPNSGMKRPAARVVEEPSNEENPTGAEPSAGSKKRPKGAMKRPAKKGLSIGKGVLRPRQ